MKESLEEAIIRLNPPNSLGYNNIDGKEGFKRGVEWQKERSYTLDEISTLFISDKRGYFDEFLDYRLNLHGENPNNDKLSFKDWFEQIKK